MAASVTGAVGQQQLGEAQQETKKPSFFGKIEHEISEIAKNVFEGFRLLFVRFGQIRMDANAFGRALQLGGFAFSVAEIAIAKPGNFAHISARLGTTKNFVDTMQALDCIHYYGNKGTKKSAANCLGYASMLVASVGIGIEVLDKCKLLSLGKIAEKIGSIPVLGSITKIGLNFGQVITSFAAFGYSCFGVDAIERIIDAKNGDDKRQAWIDLAWFVSEVAAAVFVVFASAYIGGVIALGALAATLGLASYMHGIAVKEREAETASPLLPVKV